MISDVEDADSRFGIVLIKEGVEVGHPAVPHYFGTMGRIVRADRAEDGRILVSLIGERRFRVKTIIREFPYLVARVELLSEETQSDVPKDVFESAQGCYQEYLQSLAALQGGWVQDAVLDTNPEQLSFLIGHTIIADPLVKQHILEAVTSFDRLEIEIPLLEKGVERIKVRMQDEGPQARFSSN